MSRTAQQPIHSVFGQHTPVSEVMTGIDLTDQVAVVTGGYSGIGVATTRALAAAGATVIVPVRNRLKARQTLADVPGDVVIVDMDLSDLASVRACAKQIADTYGEIHILINNAGVMACPEARLGDGWESQFATNHLGHFRLNAQLFPLLEASAGRIVPVSSIAHKYGSIHLDDLMWTKRYDPTDAYSQSKLANLMYAFELQRRLAERGSTVTSIACHPGYSATNLQSAGVGMEGGSGFFRNLYAVTNRLVAQSATKGSYPLALAVADPTAKPGAYYGPTGLAQLGGAVGESFIDPRAKDTEVARKLWEATEALVGPFFPDA